MSEISRVQFDLARRQADPEAEEFVKPKGGRPKTETVGNTNGFSEHERTSNPGILRRLARSRPDLLGRVETGEKALVENPAATQEQIGAIVGLSRQRVQQIADEIANEKQTKSSPKMLNHGGKREKQGDDINYSKSQRKAGTDPSYIIARLKRDAATDPKAAALLGSIDAGDIKPYRAAVDMGWVRPMKSIPVDSAAMFTFL